LIGINARWWVLYKSETIHQNERVANMPQSSEEASISRELSKESVEMAGVVFSNVVACVDGSPHARDVLSHAAAVSAGQNAPLTVIRVLESTSEAASPHDPVAWDLRRREAIDYVRNLLAACNREADATVEVIVGPVQDRISSFLVDHDVDLCVLGSAGEGEAPALGIGSTARRIVDNAPCSVLLIPPRHTGTEPAAEPGAIRYRRLLVPLDCSRRAETVLPVAVSLGDAYGAEIVLAHAVPDAGLTEIGPLDEADVALRNKLRERNERAAKRYLSRMRAQLALNYRAVRTLILRGGDARHMLARAAADEAADIIVLSAKGAGGHPDQSLGSVAEYLITHIGKPILIVRSRPNRKPEAIIKVVGSSSSAGPVVTVAA
jgi:nucleotide-binding universal stress UspA family protein